MKRDELKRRYDDAVLIRGLFAERAPPARTARARTGFLAQIEANSRKLRSAELRGWPFAARELRQNEHRLLQQFADELADAANVSRLQIDPPYMATVNDIYRDVIELTNEYGAVDFCRKQQTVTITTGGIELEGVYLGPFEICLSFASPNDATGLQYEVIACDPNPAASGDGVHHPHVQHQTLCEGEAHSPIRNALLQGRLLDFYQVVVNVLETYNAESPYIALDKWQGVDCADCGYGMGTEEISTCDECSTQICDECRRGCRDCDDVSCSECIETCDDCGDALCKSCIQSCGECANGFCKDCLNEKEWCNDCEEKRNEERSSEEESDGDNCEAGDSKDDTSAAGATTEVALHADGLGKAAVPA